MRYLSVLSKPNSIVQNTLKILKQKQNKFHSLTEVTTEMTLPFLKKCQVMISTWM